MVEDAYIRQSEAAKMLGVTRACISNYLKRKQLKAYNRYGSRLVKRSDILKRLAGQPKHEGGVYCAECAWNGSEAEIIKGRCPKCGGIDIMDA